MCTDFLLAIWAAVALWGTIPSASGSANDKPTSLSPCGPSAGRLLLLNMAILRFNTAALFKLLIDRSMNVRYDNSFQGLSFFLNISWRITTTGTISQQVFYSTFLPRIAETGRVTIVAADLGIKDSHVYTQAVTYQLQRLFSIPRPTRSILWGRIVDVHSRYECCWLLIVDNNNCQSRNCGR